MTPPPPSLDPSPAPRSATDRRSPSRSAWPIRVVAGATSAVAMAYLLALAGAGTASTWAMVAGLAMLLPSLMALGAPRAGRRRRVVGLALWGTGIVLALAFGLAVALPASEGVRSPVVLGLPLRAAIVVYGAGVLPMVVLPLVYAWSFEDDGFDVDHLRRLAAPSGDPAAGSREVRRGAPSAPALASAEPPA